CSAWDSSLSIHLF
nr:immunoglobulin light chain junction region [Macaca mulatta]MPO03049.1 immunoglobulin light chain junction region [Macaca mulatta]MPO03063.1 immunoglobulin light chain junction region [Macaca mulatta]MPO03084.1 immunoglobulin light chain junction region [Macaca mulatta]MPO03481.1 immunoglobulin light chain junction region [Macaca mulatta]